MSGADDQAKQLDSVTDRVEEKDQQVDTNKAKQALASMASKKVAVEEQAAVSKDDVDLIVNELETTRELAEKTLREVKVDAEESQVAAALRKLITT